MAALSEKALVEQAKKDPQAFAALYDRFFRRIYTFVYMQMNDESLAKDLTAATFEKGLRNISRYQWRNVSFAAWLYRIARNEIGQHRRRQRSNERNIDYYRSPSAQTAHSLGAACQRCADRGVSDVAVFRAANYPGRVGQRG